MSSARGPRDQRTSASRAPGRGQARRPGGRPGVRSTGGGARSGPTGRRAPAHVRRMLALATLVVVMSLILAPVLSGYLRQRAEITAAQQQIEAERQAIADLEREVATWSDPDFVELAARERLRFVKEGETAFTVIDDTGTDHVETLPGMAPVSEDVIATSPWYGQVWASVQVANEGLPETTEP